MKSLKFSEPLIKMILERKKNVTWRICDEKNIVTGDLLSLCNTGGEEFTKAKVIGVKETTFENLTDEDKEGHEKFSSDKEMYKTYSNYHEMKITPKTKVKVIRFRLA